MKHLFQPRAISRLLAFSLVLAALAACSFSPLGQANQPTFTPVAQQPTAEPPPPTAEPPQPTAAQAAGGQSEATQPPSQVGGSQPSLITGKFTYTNDIITTYYVEHAAALVDMYGFVKRDKEWEVPVESQVLGFMKLDESAKTGEYRIQLPERPLGQVVNVSHDGKQGAGVQVFATTYWPNLAGGPYSEGDDPSRGWPSYLASTVNDPENEDEVTGGKLVVWAPDAGQQFPSGFGADGKLFTDDDPVAAIPAGWSVVDLDKQPFAVSQDAQQDLTLYEPKDVAVKDFSKLAYGDAFKQMVDKLRVEYAFNGIEGKAPNWDDLYSRYSQRVAEAEQAHDAEAFAAAIHDFTLEFHDGHVGANGPGITQVLRKQIGGGYGFAVRGLDDGRLIVTYVLKGGPADAAGMAVGAELTEFDGKPAAEAVAAVKPFDGPFSTDFGRRTAQENDLVRAPVGTEATVGFTNPGKSPQSARLQAVAEFQSYLVTSPFANQSPADLPVEFRILDSGAGYIKVGSNNDDLNLIVRLFERALKTFQQNDVKSLIVDMRVNAGGAPLSLAGLFTNKVIPLGQLEYYSDKTGKFEPEGPREKVEPYQSQYHFDKMALLVNQYCYSACEIESYGLSQLPGIVVVGQHPTAGVEAEVARGEFKLPDGITAQFPTGRFVMPDGSLFLEGQGVQPTLRVPINEQNVLSSDDVVLKAAEDALSR